MVSIDFLHLEKCKDCIMTKGGSLKTSCSLHSKRCAESKTLEPPLTIHRGMKPPPEKESNANKDKKKHKRVTQLTISEDSSEDEEWRYISRQPLSAVPNQVNSNLRAEAVEYQPQTGTTVPAENHTVEEGTRMVAGIDEPQEQVLTGQDEIVETPLEEDGGVKDAEGEAQSSQIEEESLHPRTSSSRKYPLRIRTARKTFTYERLGHPNFI
ncbi:hypothetical protein SRHO_G00070270 [Serrasalmus rhombeus]